MKVIAGLLLICLLITGGLAAASSNLLVFRENGFSIKPLEGDPGQQNYVALMMFLPASDAFSANVNVVMRPYQQTINDYVALTKKQFDKMGWRLLKAPRIDKTSAVFEYSGKMQGRGMHWYTKTVLRGNKVYLVTATATEEQWTSVSGKLKACVDSFQLN
jgi:hypothetical protein